MTQTGWNLFIKQIQKESDGKYSYHQAMTAASKIWRENPEVKAKYIALAAGSASSSDAVPLKATKGSKVRARSSRKSTHATNSLDPDPVQSAVADRAVRIATLQAKERKLKAKQKIMRKQMAHLELESSSSEESSPEPVRRKKGRAPKVVQESQDSDVSDE